MADVVVQAVAERENPRREAKGTPLVEKRQPEVQNTYGEENDMKEELSCYKTVLSNKKSQLDLSGPQQRDVAILMGDNLSPAASVISINSELTDGEDEAADPDPQRCCLSQWVKPQLMVFSQQDTDLHQWPITKSCTWLLEHIYYQKLNHVIRTRT